jgi:hypothetical protein
MLNRLPKVIRGYHPSEAAYQVKKDTLFVYLRLVEFYIPEQTFERLNEVEVIQIPVKELKEQFHKKLKEFEATLFPYVINHQKRYTSKTEKYRVGNMQYTFEYRHDSRNKRNVHFSMEFLFGYQKGVTLVEGVYSLDFNKTVITSKSGTLKRYFKSI